MLTRNADSERLTGVPEHAGGRTQIIFSGRPVPSQAIGATGHGGTRILPVAGV